MTPRVFCDMDGVLCDFNYGWKEFTGKTITNWVVISDDDWGHLKKQWPTFWMDLELMPYAEQLWDALSAYSPDLLTAVPDSWKSAGVGKASWARENLSGRPEVLAVSRQDKRKYAKQKDGTPNVLIDDMEKNIGEWNAAGGLGIRYISGKTAIGEVVRTIEAHMERHGE